MAAQLLLLTCLHMPESLVTRVHPLYSTNQPVTKTTAAAAAARGRGRSFGHATRVMRGTVCGRWDLVDASIGHVVLVAVWAGAGTAASGVGTVEGVPVTTVAQAVGPRMP